jgi:hypothetical protein
VAKHPRLAPTATAALAAAAAARVAALSAAAASQLTGALSPLGVLVRPTADSGAAVEAADETRVGEALRAFYASLVHGVVLPPPFSRVASPAHRTALRAAGAAALLEQYRSVYVLLQKRGMGSAASPDDIARMLQ